MTLLQRIMVVQFATILALVQNAQGSKRPKIPEQPEVLVQSLYNEVIARHPVGIPGSADMKTFAPYLSKSLLRRIDLARACEDNYYRQHQNPNEKPEIEWLEFGLFTGGNEKVSPRAFQVETAQSDKDGSYRVYVRLTWGPPSKPWIWRVTAIVVREDDHFVVDEIVFMKDEKTLEDESRLTEILAAGCDGARWIGYKDQRSDPKR